MAQTSTSTDHESGGGQHLNGTLAFGAFVSGLTGHPLLSTSIMKPGSLPWNGYDHVPKRSKAAAVCRPADMPLCSWSSTYHHTARSLSADPAPPPKRMYCRLFLHAILNQCRRHSTRSFVAPPSFRPGLCARGIVILLLSKLLSSAVVLRHRTSRRRASIASSTTDSSIVKLG